MRFTYSRHLPLAATLFIAGWSSDLPALAGGRPGSVISGVVSIIERPGQVAAASLAADGTVNIAGIFSQVDGRAASGLVRLKADGSVDESFRPAVGLVERPDLPPVLQPIPGIGMCPLFQLFDNGNLLIGDPPGLGRPDVLNWAVLEVGGQIIVNALPAVMEDEPLIPQFVRDGRLVVITSRRDAATGLLRPVVRRLILSNGEDDPAFSVPQFTGTPLQLLPAANGGTWVLEKTSYFDSLAGNWFRLSRLDTGGVPDPAHTPRMFSATSASLMETGGGAFALTSSSLPLFWPATSWTHQVDFRTANDAPASPGGPISLAGNPPFLTEPDGSVVMQEPTSGWLAGDPEPLRRTLWRRLPDGTADPGFHPPLAAQTLTRLADGRLLADGHRRYLADGNSDPSWSVPALLPPLRWPGRADNLT